MIIGKIEDLGAKTGKTIPFDEWAKKLEARRLEEEKPKCEHFWLPYAWCPDARRFGEVLVTNLYCAKCLQTKDL